MYKRQSGTSGSSGTSGNSGSSGTSGSSGSSGSSGTSGSSGSSGSSGTSGSSGQDGNFGGATFNYDFEANTNVGADPGSGDIRLNQSNQNTSTISAISQTTGDGDDIEEFLQSIDASTSAVKGHMRMACLLYTSPSPRD